jgi:hypothetical protein
MRLILLACLLALPAQADPAADFQRLTETFPTLGFAYDAKTQLDQAKTFVAGMTGTWVQIGPPRSVRKWPSPRRRRGW